MLRALWTRFLVSCRKWLMIELRLRPLIMLWLAAASEQVNLVILIDNLEVLLWRPWRVVCGVWHELKLVPRTSSPAGPTTSSPSSVKSTGTPAPI